MGKWTGNMWDGTSQALRGAFLLVQTLAVVGLIGALFGPEAVRVPALGFAIVLNTVILAVGINISRGVQVELAQRKQLLSAAHASSQQIEELFGMTDMLQSAEDHADAGSVLSATSLRLLPTFSGALYVFNNSRDRLDLVKQWNETEHFSPSAALLPGNCWALKRGKPHVNHPASGTLCCTHHVDETATIEIPMMARGSVYGLLVLSAHETDANPDTVHDIKRLAMALADSMSLALSNISLREKLRTQSLRDPLTGLYNRRYMEDALERYISLAERTGTATSVVMIDLDNFKRLNDQNGHAKGDAVLRDVAAQLIGALRPSDVICRYGGEELLVILPNCSVEDAMLKAEMMRARIESLTDAHDIPISASFGVAGVPECSAGTADVIPMADAALYVAKQSGKNCVRAADRRAARDDTQLRLAVP